MIREICPKCGSARIRQSHWSDTGALYYCRACGKHSEESEMPPGDGTSGERNQVMEQCLREEAAAAKKFMESFQ